MKQRLLERYNDRDRMNHWVVALLFVLAGLSGLAFFHPAFFPLTQLFGGPVWARIIHPFLGVLMAALALPAVLPPSYAARESDGMLRTLPLRMSRPSVVESRSFSAFSSWPCGRRVQESLPDRLRRSASGASWPRRARVRDFERLRRR